MARSGAVFGWSLGLVVAVSAGLHGLWPTGDAPAPSAPSTSTRPAGPALPEAVAVAPGALASPTVTLPPDIARNPFGGKDWADAAPRPLQPRPTREPGADTAAAPQADAASPSLTAPGTATESTHPAQPARQPLVLAPAHVDGDNAPGIGLEPAPAPQPE